MRNLTKLSRSSHGGISNLLLRFNPSSSSSSSTATSIQHLFSTTIAIPHPHHHHRHPNPKPFSAINPNSPPTLPVHIHGEFNGGSLGIKLLRFYSSESKPNPDDSKNPDQKANPGFKHQEIEGPTVERDLSPLANETREVSLRLMKTMYDVSRVLAILGLSQLALGAWIAYTTASSLAATAMSLVAFALPFSMAFMLRQSLKHMHFFNKMEQIGRLQILTSTMQISKHVHLFFVRLRAVVYLCLAGLPLPFLFSLLSSSSSSSS